MAISGESRLQGKVCHFINFQLFTEAKNNFDVSANHIRSTAKTTRRTPTRTAIATNEWLRRKQRTNLIPICDAQMSIN